MKDRRSFFLAVLGAGACACVPRRVPARVQGEPPAPRAPAAPEPEKGLYFASTILCQLVDTVLLPRLFWEAERLSCRILFAEPGSWDIVASPCFVQILDRNTIGAEQWTAFLDIRRECSEETDELCIAPDPCLLVDGLGAKGEWAVDRWMEIIDPSTPEGMRRLLSRVREEHQKAGVTAERLRQVVEDLKKGRA